LNELERKIVENKIKATTISFGYLPLETIKGLISL
jgi:hypothetical protein